MLKDAANGRTYHVPSGPNQEEIPEVVKPGNLFQFAIYLDDPDLLQFLIGMGEDCTLRNNATTEEAVSKFFRFEEADFLYAIRLGRVQLLENIIKRTGVGIPLDDLVKKSGVEITKKPKFYQGLSVHGKKRADWANAGRETQAEEAGAQHPPLLHAARLGSLESVEWFSSDAALRCYSEFADNHRDDVRIQNLAKSKGGLEAAISKWLNLRSHLLIHTVVLSKTTEDSLKLLRHLCKTQPESLHHRSASGMTPLQLAFTLHRVEMIKILLEAGADQTCRNNAGGNIVHSILNDNFLNFEKDLGHIRELFGLIDPRLLASLFTERTTVDPGAATPLARWIHANIRSNYYNHAVEVDREKFVQVILEFSKGEDLSMVNGEGDTPIHVALRYGADAVLRTMLECRPDLLFRENASGRTPYEMAEDAYLSKEVFNDPPSLSASSNAYHYGAHRRRIRAGQQDLSSVLSRQPETFVEDPKDTRSGVEKVWQVCKEFAEKSQGTKRKLVSLVEANEVAKRLALKKGSAESEEKVADENTKDEEEVKGDEVAVWYYMALNADR